MSLEIETVEMHTGGEPVRLVTAGYPAIPGATILAKRRHAREHLDHLRRLLMFEPRGHFDMYGVLPVEPDLPEADLAVLFIHNEGYSTMCGHAVIALARWAVDSGRVARREPETHVAIQCPCGLVQARYPQAVLRITHSVPDARDYRVSGDRIRARGGFSPQYTIDAAFAEVAEAVRDGVFRDPLWNGHSAAPAVSR